MSRLLALWSIIRYNPAQIDNGEFFNNADVKQELDGITENEYK